MDGLLIIDKADEMTSHDVVARVRRILGTRRVGHTGTLDPFATGVMVILLGHATRLAQFLDKDDKEYEALVQLGWETDTGDRTGSRIAHPGSRISQLDTTTDWDKVFAKFRGEILQTPPMYSAKKIDGKKLYELARQGVEVEREAVKVRIRELELLKHDDQKSQIRIRVVCSAGTYIRTLAVDIGRAIGTGAHLLELRRTRAGRFGLEDAVTLAELEKLNHPASRLHPASDAVMHLPCITLSFDRVAKTKSGLATRTPDDTFENGATVRMLGPDADLIAIGIYDAQEKSVKPKIVLL